MANRWGKNGNQWQILFSWTPKSVWMVDCSHEMLLGRKAMTNLDVFTY